MTANLYRLTATELVQGYKDDSFTVEDYANSLIMHIDARQPTVKAWCYFNSHQVLEQARRLDTLPKSERGPLHGVGVAVKDVIYTKGSSL